MDGESSLNDQMESLNVDKDKGPDDILVIGIDFGTTYSGVAWATNVEFEDKQVNFITSWPGNGREEGKVPTEIFYDEDGEPSWGYEIPADEEPFRWFKLLLLRTEDIDPNTQDSKFIKQARQMIEESDKSATDLVADYLRLLWEHVLSTIERSLGESVLEALSFHVVITVPAIWKDYARQAMTEAAKCAGILDSRDAGETKLSFAPEPEAAALSTLLEQGNGVRPGNVYVVCDAGGGTVDLISYEVKSTKPIVLNEAVEGTGGLCGGIFIDEAFEIMCRGRLGTKWNRLTQTGLKEIMKNQWEYGIKPQFRLAKAKKAYIVSLPAEVFKGQGNSSLDDTTREPYIKSGRIHFLSSNIKTVFEGVFADIEELVEGQVKKAAERDLSVTGIILVGGLGCSPYLYDHLKSKYSSAGVTVLQSGGMKPRTAICRGAVFRGFLEAEQDGHENSSASKLIGIDTTISRASYGVDFEKPFDISSDLEEDRFWSHHRGEWMAKNQMKWYIKRGDTVTKSKAIRMTFYRRYTEKEFSGSLSKTLYRSDNTVPPSRRNAEVELLGTLQCNLDIGFSDLEFYRSNNGQPIRRLEFEIELVPSGASLEFSVYVQGRKQGSQSIQVEFN